MTDDWFDMLAALTAQGARFLVVGAHALAVHGVPRGTQDLDIWIESNSQNVARVWKALAVFGAPLESLDVDMNTFLARDTVVQIGLPPNRIDVLTSITGVPSFDDAWNERVERLIRELPVPFLGRSTLLRNKRATARSKDLADVEELEKRTDGSQN